MARMLMLLSPPRSFSSLISTMIGQHPEVYGFPELHLMMRETVGEVLRYERNTRHYLGPPGLLRALAELVFGGQTPVNILSAANWVEDRSHWRTSKMMNFMMDRASDAEHVEFGLEKSPSLVFFPAALNRVRLAWPDARFIHVTRHPVNFKTSMDELIQTLPRLSEEQKKVRVAGSMALWPVAQRNILDFCATLSPEQYLRVRGEDVLEDAPRIMKQVAAWLDLGTDPPVIDAMLRPEESPYATLGPINAPFGNDPKFISNPKFRAGKARMGSLEAWLEQTDGQKLDHDRRTYLSQLAHCLGYH